MRLPSPIVQADQTVQRDLDAIALRIPDPAGTFYAPPNFGNTAATVLTANSYYTAQIRIPFTGGTKLTGITFNCTAAAGNITVALHSSTGALIASSASTAAAGAVMQIPFSTAATVGAGIYFIGLIPSGAPTVQTASSLSPSSITAVGGYSVPSPLTVPTVVGAVVPSMSTY